MIPSRGEKYICKLYKRKVNSFEYEEVPYATFYARPASSLEVKTYTLIEGVIAKDDNQHIVTSNLPKDINLNDKVIFMGQEKLITSFGYYLDRNNIIDASIFKSDYLFNVSPKGIVLS